jgi:hypothetical protein
MSNKDFSHINPSLKIGGNCFLMNTSSILECRNMLSLSLSYTNFDFIYNPDYFTTFINPKPAEEYISKENEILLVGDTDAVYHRDYDEYIYKGIDNLNLFSVNAIDSNILLDLELLNAMYLENMLPVIFSCDHYYVYDDYKKSTTDMAHYHSPGHAATIVNINFDSKTCYVIDKFFSFMGEIRTSSYLNSVSSEYISEPSGYCVQIKSLSEMAENERLRMLLKHNISSSLEDSVTINNIKYYKNLTAIALFIENFERNLYEITEQKGKYAPQFTTRLLQPVRLNKRGFSNLLTYIKQVIRIKEFSEVEVLCKEVSKLWARMDALCDKCFLVNSTIIQYKDKLLNVLNEIYEIEKVIFEQLSNISNRL